MFEPGDAPHLFGLPCGVDYPREIKRGLLARLAQAAPEQLARTEIFVNTSRMKRDILAAFDDGTTRLLPRVRLLSDLGSGHEFMDLPLPANGLHRRLELAQLVARFLESEPQFATRASVYDLADSLALLLSEMQDEGVAPETIRNLNVPNASGHWEKSLRFLSIIFNYFDPSAGFEPSAEDRLRMVVDRLETRWRSAPPDHPILVAGSTGSRGTTARFMDLVASLPMGAVILPGVDFDMPTDAWRQIAGDGTADRPAIEHPQERTVRIVRRLGLERGELRNWSGAVAPDATRNRLVSLALRPAPVTHQWMKEGPEFEGVAAATAAVTLLEAPDLRLESNAVALILRKAAEDGRRAALVTPDRDLARRVTALLDRWGIEPDDSAGIPLNQTPPGRLLRHVVGFIGRAVSAEDLLVLLKHPLSARGTAGQEGRGFHLLWTRELEVHLRRKGPAFPARDDLRQWAETSGRGKDDAVDRGIWADWVATILETLATGQETEIAAHVRQLSAVAGRIVKGPHGEDDRELWAQGAGREARRILTDLERASGHGGRLTTQEFADLFRAVLGRGLARDPEPKHPGVMIWGTLEARALNADLVIVSGLNEGVWPQAAGQDPWFSRDMRRQAGLVSPEQGIGLSAHDFQQAIGAREVILTRAKRDAEAETVASRWLIRLTNLMAGMSEEGRLSLAGMRERGALWLRRAETLDMPETPVAPARRPSPRPPVAARPRQLSVTRIETLIRDPYAIYASRILRLDKLDALSRDPDVRERGTALHAIMEAYLTTLREETFEEGLARLLATAEHVLEKEVAWPAARRVWLGRIRRIAGELVRRERARLETGTPEKLEVSGAMHFPEVDFSLTGKADRIDRKSDGTFAIYDYKSGSPPSEQQTRVFAVQLLLEAAMLEAGRFEALPEGRVSEVCYLGLDTRLKETAIPLETEDIRRVTEQLRELVGNYDDPARGYSSRRMMARVNYPGDFDHLARYGEWSEADDPVPEDLE
ncbi:double-strand break repair protein AddB [Celeribacter indicus]|uniref:Putative helicase/exonuclease n=1 Tax=Celeribacter indicus TaxID=1208324 RepID=A0A0B5DNW9_9RHOB|nr:double-strand break repair protein AddB [Celeribacter indicus]AJE44909.1 putative helicase/exonuclease [Celeribacter indicus]SDW97480.1 ATP-dependent helicase/nuclease subunit B [Celeribacter indicus]